MIYLILFFLVFCFSFFSFAWLAWLAPRAHTLARCRIVTGCSQWSNNWACTWFKHFWSPSWSLSQDVMLDSVCEWNIYVWHLFVCEWIIRVMPYHALKTFIVWMKTFTLLNEKEGIKFELKYSLKCTVARWVNSSQSNDKLHFILL